MYPDITRCESMQVAIDYCGTDLIRDDELAVSKICRIFNLSVADISILAAINMYSARVYCYYVDWILLHDIHTQKIFRELACIIALLRISGYDECHFPAWFKSGLPLYNWMSPMEVVRSNKGDNIVADLVGLQVGATGG